ncbi:MAG: hypothetical protein GWP08_18925, partial [Nitrospiraceae bacterium]|nr:hypothetical protein [Nitrospiraceae bacterium]
GAHEWRLSPEDALLTHIRHVGHGHDFEHGFLQSCLDVAGMLRVHGDQLDWDYIRREAAQCECLRIVRFFGYFFDEYYRDDSMPVFRDTMKDGLECASDTECRLFARYIQAPLVRRKLEGVTYDQFINGNLCFAGKIWALDRMRRLLRIMVTIVWPSRHEVTMLTEGCGIRSAGRRRLRYYLNPGLPGLHVVCVAGGDVSGSPTSQAAVNCWNYLIRKNWIGTADWLLNYLGRLLLLPVGEALEAGKFLARLEELAPDLIVSTADVYNKALGTYAVAKSIPFYILIADTSVFLDLVHPHATHICYFQETINIVRGFDLSRPYFSCAIGSSLKGLGRVRYVLKCYADHLLHPLRHPICRHAASASPPRNRVACMAIGPLAEAKHFSAGASGTLKSALGLDNGRDTVLVASGSIGGQFLTDAADSIRARAVRPVNLLLVCGNDTVTYDRLRAAPARNEKVHIAVVPFVEDFDKYLALADCVVTRASGGVFTESLLHHTPTIALGRIPSNDRGALDLMHAHGLGEVCPSKRKLADVVDRVLQNRAQYKQRIAVFLGHYPRAYDEMRKILTQEFLRAMVATSEGAQYEDDRHGGGRLQRGQAECERVL